MQSPRQRHPSQQHDGAEIRRREGVTPALSNWAPPNQGKPSRHHLQTPTIKCVWNRDVQISDEHVGGDTPSCFPADSGGGTLQCEPSSPQNPARERAARWWPNASSERPHRQKRREKGMEIRRRRKRRTRKSCGSMRVKMLLGDTERATTLRPHQGTPGLHSRRSFVLPTPSVHSWFRVFRLPIWRPGFS